ncbi:MAG: 16S rRNA (uracil(1498)-N(3))-methyltransferase [Acidobacteriota bacterium]|nr:MAG: 16S rRNA (uracil(1498)-N(3))-methyltransferase [Acidobacteriota bacterium]
MRRFHSPDIDPETGFVTLDREQAAHARSVLRLREGDTVGVFDGNGNEFLCEIGSIGKREAVLKIVRQIDPPALESPLELTLAAAILKNEKFDLVIQKSVELGVSRLIPLLTKRTEAQARGAEKRIERWKRIAVESSKQCGRAKVMEIGTPSGLSEIAGRSADLKIVFAEGGGSGLPNGAKPESVIAVVGPEGGWEEEELAALLETGFHRVTLGGRILRAETAAIAAAALLQHRFGDLA